MENLLKKSTKIIKTIIFFKQITLFLGGGVSSLLGKNIMMGRGEGNIMAVGNIMTWKRGNGEAISSFL